MKVWILERKYSAINELNKMKQLKNIATEKPENFDDAYNKAVLGIIEKMDDKGNFWGGIDGYIDLNVFTKLAKKRISEFPTTEEFRVVLADIPDGSKYWLGYCNGVVDREKTEMICN